MPNEDVHRVHDLINQQHSPLSQAISDFQTKSNSGIYESHSAPSRQQEFYAPHHTQQHFQPPPHQQPSMHSGQQYNQQQNYNQPINSVYPGQYDQQQNYDQSSESTEAYSSLWSRLWGQ